MKKHRNRVWYTGLYKEDAKKVSDSRIIPEGAIFFDKEKLAYSFAMQKRLEPVRDAEGNLIVDDKGYAQLPDLGRLTVIGIKGEQMDWRRIEKAPKGALREIGIQGDSIKALYPVQLNKLTLSTVLEETTEMYENFAKSPLAKAGGVPSGTTADEDNLSETEHGADESHG